MKGTDKGEKQVTEQSGEVVEKVEHNVKNRGTKITTHKKTEVDRIERRPIWFMNRR